VEGERHTPSFFCASTLAPHNTAAASYGLQAGVQEIGDAMFLMIDSARKYKAEPEQSQFLVSTGIPKLFQIRTQVEQKTSAITNLQ